MGMLSEKVTLVTGGASGIGKGTALRFAAEGAKVAIVDIDLTDGRAVVAEIDRLHGSGRAIAIACDVSQPGQVKAAVDETVAAFGRLDVVFANAGINGVWAPIEEISPEEWDRTHNVNLKGTFLTIHSSIPHLRGAGRSSIIICSSVNGTRTFSTPGASVYAASKAGQVALMKMAALELARYGIRVNAVCPGAIHTNIDDSTKKRDIEKIDIKLSMPAGNPALHQGVGEPVDVADTCVFLASDLSRHVSGVEIFVDGGASLLR